MRKIGIYSDYKLQREEFDSLIQLLTEKTKRSEIETILKTLLTPSEKVAIAQRLAIVRELIKNTGYEEIIKAYKTTNSTITKTRNQINQNQDLLESFKKILAKVNFGDQKEVKAPSNAPLYQGPRSYAREIVRLSNKNRSNT